MRFRSFESKGACKLAVKEGARWRDLGEVDVVDILTGVVKVDDARISAAPVVDLEGAKLCAPVANPGKFLCVGLNYVDHAKESPYEGLPTYPAFFPRFTTSLVAAGEPMIRPQASVEFDFEGELAVIIGKTARHVSEEDALACVGGYSVFNDGSLRDFQFFGAQWTPGKNFDGTGAFGPDLVTPDELPKGAAGLELKVTLNGEVMQRGNTGEMIFPVAKLISLASQFATLEPGDVIVTGTPAGVGFARDPQIFMKDGDVVEVSIEQVGVLTNHVRDEALSKTGRAAE